MRVAIVGTGISGLGCALRLKQALGDRVQISLFEAEDRPGGHTHTVDVTLDGVTHGVDTGFLVLNERTYPRLLALFAELDVPLAKSDMSFSARIDSVGIEWSGSDLNTVFAQRSNLFKPAFLGMLLDILRFNKQTTELASKGIEAQLAVTVSEFLADNGYGQAFRDWYFVPMIAAIWSCPEQQMMQFPMATMIRFCHNHGLLQVNDRPQWFTVRGGAREYVKRILAQVGQPRLGTPVLQVDRSQGLPRVVTHQGTETFDEVVFASHSDQTLRLLTQPSPQETEVLGAIGYQPNRALLHTDTSLLPRRPLAWAAWNYQSHPTGGGASVGVHYLINRLQPLPFTSPVIVSLNPPQEPEAAKVIREIHYSHPVFDKAAVDAQARLPELQGQAHTWFCGAWTRYGFHEDGLMSGEAVAAAVARRLMGEDQTSIAA